MTTIKQQHQQQLQEKEKEKEKQTQNVSSSKTFTSNQYKLGMIFVGLFLASGVANTLIVQLIYNNITFSPRTMFTNIFIFSGYAMLNFFRDPTTTSASNNSNNSSTTKKKQPASKLSFKKYLLLAIFDCAASLLTTVGQIAVGSGLFQVLFSSKIIFSATLSRFYLKANWTTQRLISILIIFSGLCVCVYRPPQSLNNTTTTLVLNSTTSESIETTALVTSSQSQAQFIFGCCAVLLAAFIFSASHIYTEFLMSEYDITPFSFAAKYGTYSVFVCFIYIMTVTLYNQSEWVINPISQATHEQVLFVFSLFSILTVTSVCRSSSIFTILSQYGSVAMGVLYALQSVIVFSSSALFLCDPSHPLKSNQCMTYPKMLGSTIVVFGIIYYSFQSNKQKSSNK